MVGDDDVDAAGRGGRDANRDRRDARRGRLRLDRILDHRGDRFLEHHAIAHHLRARDGGEAHRVLGGLRVLPGELDGVLDGVLGLERLRRQPQRPDEGAERLDVESIASPLILICSSAERSASFSAWRLMRCA